MKQIDKHIKELNKEGLTYIYNAFTKEECKNYINRFSYWIKSILLINLSA